VELAVALANQLSQAGWDCFVIEGIPVADRDLDLVLLFGDVAMLPWVDAMLDNVRARDIPTMLWQLEPLPQRPWMKGPLQPCAGSIRFCARNIFIGRTAYGGWRTGSSAGDWPGRLEPHSMRATCRWTGTGCSWFRAVANGSRTHTAPVV
jgi:hypothetical protein